jgi:hypothetical protein
MIELATQDGPGPSMKHLVPFSQWLKVAATAVRALYPRTLLSCDGLRVHGRDRAVLHRSNRMRVKHTLLHVAWSCKSLSALSQCTRPFQSSSCVSKSVSCVALEPFMARQPGP